MSIIFVFLSVVLFLATFFTQLQLNEAEKNKILTSEENLLEVENSIISNKINKITADLLFTKDCFLMNYNKENGNSITGDIWLALSNRKGVYDQIRYIDVNGNEIIRVNYYEDGAALVPEEELQNKSSRDYFIDTIGLDENYISVSKLDLNKEYSEIEEPIKPILRVSTPCYDENGELLGIIIINYKADDMLDQVEAISSTSQGNISLINSDGYWLFNSENSDLNWGFMYEDRLDDKFSTAYPEIWSTIQSDGNGYEIGENGIYIYSDFLLDNIFSIGSEGYFFDSKENWMMVSYISSDIEGECIFTQGTLHVIKTVIWKYILGYLVIFVVAVISTIGIIINKIDAERVKYYSEFDAMTGVYNRRAGFEKLDLAFKNISKVDCKVSICYIDINGLKEVNDNLGHEVGDELILSIIEGLQKNIRQNDFISRLGGDEFLLIFQGIGQTKAEEIWNRILEYYNDINMNEDRNYVISVSHGIETIECDSRDQIDIVVNRADEKMYQEKRKIKQNIVIVRRKHLRKKHDESF